MKILVVYYSRTGTTKKIAEEIAKSLKADIEEIVDTKNRNGILGYISAGKDAIFKKITKIETIKKDPKDCELVIIGTPIWSWNLSPPIRTYLTQNTFKKTAFFCTMGGSGYKKAFEEMEKLSKKSIATLALTTKEIIKEDHTKKLEEFTKKLNTHNSFS